MLFAGALGFPVVCDVISNKKWEKFSFNTKFMLVAYSVMTFICAVTIFVTEYNNPDTLGNMPIYTKVLSSLNLTQAVRAAEMTRFDFSLFGFASKALMCFMMFVGTMPSSLGGGVKISSVAICFVFMFKYPFGLYNKDVGTYRIEQRTFEKALFIIMSSILWIFISSIILCQMEAFDYFTAVFETLSSFCLSGITTVGISSLTRCSIILTMINMMFGRFGTMLLIYISDTNRLKYSGGVEKISKISDLAV